MAVSSVSSNEEIYLDNAATTRPWPEVVQAVLAAMTEGFGNSSSLYSRGLEAARQVDRAREQIADLAGSRRFKVIFTSGGTEADCLAVQGSVPRGKRDHVVTTLVEHAAVDQSCTRLAERKMRITRIGAGQGGAVDPREIAAAVDAGTALVSVVHVASEMGSVQKVAEIARLVKAAAPRCRVHVDAVQAAAQLERLDYPLEVDMVSLSAHKIHGPQGVGALLVREGVSPRPLLAGGDQQGGIRPGTLNVAGIVGFGVAAMLVKEQRESKIPAMRELTDLLVAGCVAAVQGARLLGDPANRAAGLAVLAVNGVRSEVLLHALEQRGVIASAGSACHASRAAPPRCLVDAGLKSAEGAVRFSLSTDTTRAQIEKAIDVFAAAVAAARGTMRGVH